MYPAVELSAAILFAFAGMQVGHQGELVIVLALISLLLIVFVFNRVMGKNGFLRLLF